jgi:hypothetical protein
MGPVTLAGMSIVDFDDRMHPAASESNDSAVPVPPVRVDRAFKVPYYFLLSISPSGEVSSVPPGLSTSLKNENNFTSAIEIFSTLEPGPREAAHRQ